MKTATQELVSRDPTKTVVEFGDGTNHQFSHSDLQHIQDPTGISVEEGDFLYGLVRILRPGSCLETGTNIGVSASYIGLALMHNNHGHLTTIEHSPFVAETARNKMARAGIERVTVFTGEVAEHQGGESIDFLWLDTEMNQRYAELLRFYPQMSEGAVACIHDIWELDFMEFGGVPEELRRLIADGSLRAVTFKTMHGVTMFQKRRKHDALAEI